MKPSEPGVYLLMNGHELLYVGYGTDVPARARKRDRGHLSRWQAICQATRVKVFKCKTVSKAQQLEEKLIRLHRPPYNLRSPRGPADIAHTIALIRKYW